MLIPVPAVKTTVWSGAVLVMFKVPDVVMGEPVIDIPVPAVAATLVTVPDGVVTEPPRLIGLPLMVMLEFVSCELAMPPSVPPSVKFPLVVIEPVNVMPLTVPVPPTLVTVPLPLLLKVVQ